MAEAVWETLMCFGIENQVSCETILSWHDAKCTNLVDYGIYVR